jgi:hypothetical protein
MTSRRVFEVDKRACLFINQRTGRVCHGPVAKGDALPFCERHLKQHDRLAEVIGESTPIVPSSEERKQAL